MSTIHFATVPDRTRRDNGSLLYRIARGDDVEQNTVLTPETLRMCMQGLAQYAGDLAYSPEIQQRIQEVLERRFEADMGNDVFSMPNYAPYDDRELAAFYGVNTSMTANMQTRKENYEEQRARLVNETVREIEPELMGLVQQMKHYENESWARHGIADEDIFVHANPDESLLRNPGGGWCALDNPISTSSKNNVIELYDAVSDHVFPEPHPAWDVDRRNGMWSSLK